MIITFKSLINCYRFANPAEAFVGLLPCGHVRSDVSGLLECYHCLSLACVVPCWRNILVFYGFLKVFGAVMEPFRSRLEAVLGHLGREDEADDGLRAKMYKNIGKP